MDQPPLGWTTKAKLDRVIDGDTVDLEIKKIIRVRLDQVSAPEVRTKNIDEKIKGLLVKEKLEELIDNQEIVLFIPTETNEIKDVFTLDRVVGRLFVESEGDLNKKITGYIDEIESKD